MYTQCPECLTIYKVDAATLASARARVRCGTCAFEFDALAALADTLPDETVTTLSVHPVNLVAPQLQIPALRPKSAQADLFVAPEPKSGGPRPVPQFARRRTVERPSSWGFVVGSLVLALGLVAQLAYAERERIVRDDRLRPWAEDFCGYVNCTLPLVADREHISLVDRDVRPHPSVKDALVIAATLSNDAPFAQPFPTIEITLSDPNENKVAMRRFPPSVYVSDATALARGFAPGAIAPVHFEVVDPGKNAVAFEFRFQ